MAEQKGCVWPRAVLSGALAAALALGLGAAGAVADELDDLKQQIEEQGQQKDKIEGKIDGLETDLEFLDKDIQETAAKLQSHQAKLPAARQALAEAEGRVQSAAQEVASLGERVAAAEQTRDDLNRDLEQDQEKIDETREMIGQIATQAYKRGGVSSNLSLMLDAGEKGNLADGLDLAGQALRSQNAVLNDLSQKAATERNAQARLEAVEEEIRELKVEAEAALAREQSARDEAAARKREVDELIGQAESLSRELEAKRPEIKSQIAAHEQEQKQVISDIAERQEELKREVEERRLKAEAEAKRKAEEARKAREAAERERANQEKQRKAAEAERAAASAKRTADRENGSSRPSGSNSSGNSGGSSSSGSSSAWGLQNPAAAGAYITSGFGWRPTPAGTIDYGGAGGYLHAGIDYGFGGACGRPIYAAAGGEVWFSGWGGSSGNKVTVSHGVVRGNALATNYHHMSSIAVRNGQQVSKGQVVGYVGTTGNSTGCHLHFETILNGQAVNPLGLL
ncbi:M23 family metallopeptidase [Zhihengliuella halotolerans]|uniref:Murein DD-endopeptidase MepM/ murein hydrolase activator NlpD n=1 Tax=Zhihengliuella halotolerans TaxID=370736 RepID=A0A4Q8AC06_9MICC|nr:M23 family metallopeptidase [Zhihengliuella halotolerans]RZU61712.1 murein DD-endopeptidase MepM/ murein hydrolase activator NlpD [Zhihengliuella halotolerans]